MAIDECVECLLAPTCCRFVTQCLVLMVHIPQVAIGIVHRDLQLGALLHQLQCDSTHGKGTARDKGAANVDKGTIVEHLREILKHAMGYTLLLLLTQFRKIAPTIIGIINIQAYLAQSHLAQCGQLS